MTKSVLILGATSDVSIALARDYAIQGYDLVLGARNLDKLRDIANDLSIKYQVKVQPLVFDAENFESHGPFIAKIAPMPSIAIVVFGYLGDQKVGEQNLKEALKIINTNYTGAVSILNLIANIYEKKKEGTIVGISSVAGDRGRMSNYLYGSAKAGFTAYLSGLRNRLSHAGVHVVTVKPGFIDTKMTEGMNLPKPITAKPSNISKDIINAVKKKKNIIYTLWMWRYIMFIIKSIPEFMFKKLKL